MTRVAWSLLRISVAVVALLVAIAFAAACAFRQPNLGSVAYPGCVHADPAKLRSHVEFLASSEQPRDWEHPSNLDRAADYIANEFAKTRARISEQPYRVDSLETKNVIASFGPSTGARVVIGAHYDVCGPLPGADDNASGVAGLLELARLLDAVTLSSPVELVAYSTEEPPYFGSDSMGSGVHARSLAAAGVPVRAMISLEMIGYFTTSTDSRSPLLKLFYPSEGTYIACVGRWTDRHLVRQAKRAFRGATSVRAVSYSGPVGIGADLSDHRNYWAEGYPAFMVTDTAFIRNSNYHEPTDTVDTLDYNRMAGVVDGVLNTVVQLANQR